MNDKAIFVWHDRVERAKRLADDPSYAAEQVRKEALSGDPSAALAWAFMLLEGHGTPRDLGGAFHWFQLAARSGNRDAVNMVGRCHELGWGTAINLPMAAHCYRASAEMGHAWAQFNLACLILRKDGVPGEQTDALALLVRAARAGNVKAMSMLGRCCEEGWRGKSKPASARRWYHRAARGGCFRGAFHMSRHLLAENDIDRAVAWLRRSIATAPADFCREIGQALANHPDHRLQKVGAEASAQARHAPQHPPSELVSSPAVTTKPASAKARSKPRLMSSVVRKIAGATGVLRR